ncbi:MAG: sodium ion-translocating decarboxylase subunit beta [Clostridia bacterium]|nr:sodium ion-translocating decarboxylase subunit beta [Clostridia bacterium]
MAQILETMKTFLESTGFARLIALGDVVDVLKVIAMFAISCVLVYLAIAKKFEPLLLLPIAIGMLLGNLPGTEMFHMNLFISEDTSAVIADVQDAMVQEGYYDGDPTALTEETKLADVLAEMHANLVGAGVMSADSVVDFSKIKDGSEELVALLTSYKDAIFANDTDDSLGSDKNLTMSINSITVNEGGLNLADIAHYGGLLDLLYLGVKLGIYPCLIFMGIGAMTDFAPLIANPKSLLLGAAAQLGVFAAFFGALLLGFTPQEAASIGIIGGADGPTAILVTKTLAPHLLGAIAIAAYSYMALIPMIQPPIMKLMTSKKDRKIVMGSVRPVSKLEKILFPIVVTFTVVLIVPDAGPLVGALMFGNLLTTCGVTERISKTAQNELMNIVTIFLGITVGATATAANFLSIKTLYIIALGLCAFALSTAGGLIGGNIMCKLTKGKVNPLIGSAGVSAVPMASRVSQIQGQKENPANYLLMHAMGPNVAGVIGSAVAAGFLLANF